MNIPISTSKSLRSLLGFASISVKLTLARFAILVSVSESPVPIALRLFWSWIVSVSIREFDGVCGCCVETTDDDEEALGGNVGSAAGTLISDESKPIGLKPNTMSWTGRRSQICVHNDLSANLPKRRRLDL